MVVENLRVDVTPGGVPLIIHVSQYDAGLRQFVFTPYDKGVAMAKIAGATVTVEATKPDGYAVQHPCTYNDDGTITYTLQEQLAACEGQVWSKLTWRDSNGNVLGGKAIVWAVDMAGIEDGAIVSDSDLPLIEQAAEFAGEYEQKVAEMIAEMQIIPGQVVIDGTLTVQGAAADAKATGDRIAYLQSALSTVFTDEAKSALLYLLQHVAYTDANGQDYWDALQTALDAEPTPPEPSHYLYKLTAPMTFDGVSDEYDTGFKLLETDVSFSLLVDFTENGFDFINSRYGLFFISGATKSLYLQATANGAKTQISYFARVFEDAGFNLNLTTGIDLSDSHQRVKMCMVHTAGSGTYKVVAKSGTFTTGIVSGNYDFATQQSNTATVIVGSVGGSRYFKGTVNEFAFLDYVMDDAAMLAYVD